jgi:hypothetical protein
MPVEVSKGPKPSVILIDDFLFVIIKIFANKKNTEVQFQSYILRVCSF